MSVSLIGENTIGECLGVCWGKQKENLLTFSWTFANGIFAHWRNSHLAKLQKACEHERLIYNDADGKRNQSLSFVFNCVIWYTRRESWSRTKKRVFVFFRSTAKDGPRFEGLKRFDGKGGDQHVLFYCTIVYAKVKENEKLNNTVVISEERRWKEKI